MENKADKETKIYYGVDELAKRTNPQPLVATLGFFDGVHLGHQHLMRQMQNMAKELMAEALVITLDQHPFVVLRPDEQPPLKLATLKGRLNQMAHLGIEHILVLPFTEDLASLSTADFIRPIQKAGLKGMMLGYDNRFGQRKVGETLETFDAELVDLGLEIRRVSTFEFEGLPVSSTRIRSTLSQKNFRRLEELLGRPYSITGVVTNGKEIGRTIHYPTANIIPEEGHIVLPEVGVYISEIDLEGTIYIGMSYYGSTPTITPEGAVLNRIEVHLFDYEGDLYGKELTLSFREFIRGDEQFESLETLKAQLKEDEKVARSFFDEHPIALKPRKV